MKKYIFPILLLAIMAAFTSCNKEWDAPEFEVATYTGEPANKTIQDIINVYTNAGKMDSICHAGETFIVKATVVSSDEGGNFYKNMVVEDETGAIQIQINKSGLCHTYPVGQTVYINCQGLVVGNYHGVYQIGWIYNGDVGRIDGNFLDKYLFKDGMPKPVTPIDITSASQLSAENVCKLVCIRNCQFADEVVGQPWSTETATTSRVIKSINGQPVNNLVVRTSNYAKFRKGLIPSGSGDIIGILSVYGTTYQLMLRTTDDVLTFGSVQDIYPLSLNGGAGCDYSGWITNQNYMLHNSVNSATEDWLVTPVIPAATINGSTLYVEQAFFNTDATAQSKFTIHYTTHYTGDPQTTEWSQLTFSDYQDGVNFYQAKVADLSGLTADIRIGFRYKTANQDSGQWAVKGLHFKKLVAND